jgi:hypothetical protein
LASLIKSRTVDTLTLTNGIAIEVRAASFRNLRGVTAVAIVGDEAAFWYDESSGAANTDEQILNAVRPALATTGGLLAVITTPHAARRDARDLCAAFRPRGRSAHPGRARGERRSQSFSSAICRQSRAGARSGRGAGRMARRV